MTGLEITELYFQKFVKNTWCQQYHIYRINKKLKPSLKI